MRRIELTKSGVLFDKISHTYVLDGKALSGITGMLQRQLYPNEYNGISEAVLNAAADYGTGVHDACEMFDTQWDMDFAHETEVNDYIAICKNNGLRHEDSEYTVTDREHWASNIDKVYRVDEDTFDLGDIKTYGEMTPDKMEKARWQLSIYAYLFELQNVGAKVRKLYIIHLRNKMKKTGTYDHFAELIEVTRIPSDECKKLLDADKNGEQYKNPYCMPDEYKDAASHIRDLILMKKTIDKELDEFKEKVLHDMESKEQVAWDSELIKFRRKLPTVRVGFDLKKFKKAYPDIDYKPFETETKVSGSLTITL